MKKRRDQKSEELTNFRYLLNKTCFRLTFDEHRDFLWFPDRYEIGIEMRRSEGSKKSRKVLDMMDKNKNWQ